MKTIINLIDRKYGTIAKTITSGNPTDLIGYYLKVLDPTKQSLVIKVEGVVSRVSKWEVTDGYGWEDEPDRLWSVTMDDEWVYEPRNRRDLTEMLNKEMSDVMKIAEEWRDWL